MSTPSEIEKKSLEAHVELCAQRYTALYDRVKAMTEEVEKVSAALKTVTELLSNDNDQRNKQLISWGIGIITTLVGAIGYLITRYVI